MTASLGWTGLCQLIPCDSRFLTVTGIALDMLAGVYLLVPGLPHRWKQIAYRLTIPVRRIKLAYHRFVTSHSFDSDPRVWTHDEPMPNWIESRIEQAPEPTERDYQIVYAILAWQTWQWNTIEHFDYSVVHGVSLPEPELHDIWSEPTFQFQGKLEEGGCTANYPSNDWTRKQLTEYQSEVTTQLYTMIGAVTLVLGFCLQLVGFMF